VQGIDLLARLADTLKSLNAQSFQVTAKRLSLAFDAFKRLYTQLRALHGKMARQPKDLCHKLTA
jgi:hypothetical protein